MSGYLLRDEENDISIRILLVDDHKLVRDSLRALIEHQADDIEVVAEAADGRAAVELVRNLSPDVVVMDIGMPDLNGIEATRQILAEAPDVKVIALSMHAGRHFVADMFGAGASGYVLKESAFKELAQAIRTVVAGRTYLDSGITGVVVEGFVSRASGTEESVAPVLSVRERRVLQLLAEGKPTKQIASLLNVGEKTVEASRQSIREKLDLHSIAELTRYAIRTGLVPLES